MTTTQTMLELADELDGQLIGYGDESEPTILSAAQASMIVAALRAATQPRPDVPGGVREALEEAPQSPDRQDLAQFLCSELALEPFDELSRAKYLGDADAILKFISKAALASLDVQEAGTL
jgi:hypothetical protein